MKAVVWHGIGDISLDDVPDPKIQEPTDAIVRITASAICGTDLHLVRGTMPGMKDGTILGHEAVGVVEEVGDDVRGFRPGERVVITSTIGCGRCRYCRAGCYAQCDVANPNGPAAGTSFFGGPESTGPIDGLQAELARVPYAMTSMVRLPDSVSDDQAILLSDILPTSWFGARLAGVSEGDVVAVFGAGVFGQLAVASAKRQGAGRVLVVDGIESRLEMARAQNAEVIDFNREDPLEVIQRLTGGTGADRVIDAVGIDAQSPDPSPEEQAVAAPEGDPSGPQWVPGDAPSQVARWAVEAVAKAGTIGVIGVYGPQFDRYPIGAAMNKNLTIRLGNCNHRRYLPHLVSMVATGAIDLTPFITQTETPATAVEAYQPFDRREPGWLKTVLAV